MMMMMAVAGTETFRLSLEAGPRRSTQASIECDPAGGGDVVLRGLSKFDGDILDGLFSMPDETWESATGGNAEDVDATFESILSGTSDTKAVDPGGVWLNAAWMHDGLLSGDERDDSDLLGLELGRRFGADAVPAGDPVSGQEGFEDMDLRLVELGSRRPGAPRSVVSVGAGPGATEDTPDVRLIFAFEKLF